MDNLSLIQRLISEKNDSDDIRSNISMDVALLLNTKLKQIDLLAFPQLSNTIINYGLPDFSSLEANNSQSANKVKDKILKILTLHEPRLKNIEINVNHIAQYSIDFTITATFLTDPDPIQIKFDSKYQPDLQQFNVKDHSDSL